LYLKTIYFIDSSFYSFKKKYLGRKNKLNLILLYVWSQHCLINSVFTYLKKNFQIGEIFNLRRIGLYPVLYKLMKKTASGLGFRKDLKNQLKNQLFPKKQRIYLL